MSRSPEEEKSETIRQITFHQVWTMLTLLNSVSDGACRGSQLSAITVLQGTGERVARVDTEHDEMRHGAVVAAAIETVASMLRRELRDFGIPKEDVDVLRAESSRVAERVYEGSGMGQIIRAMAADKRARDAAATAGEAPPDDSAYSAEARAQAARLAAEALGRITLDKKEN